LGSLHSYGERHRAVVVINCMPELMRCTRMGRLDVAALVGTGNADARGPGPKSNPLRLLSSIGTWIGKQAKRDPGKGNHTQYLKLIDRLPGVLKFVPTAGALTDAKNYLYLFSYFLQPTPRNIQSMLLYALKQYLPDKRLAKLKVRQPEHLPAVAIYHPEA